MQQLPIWITSAVVVLAAQPAWAEVTTVTAVRLEPTNSGLEVILETSNGKQPLQNGTYRVLPTSFGKTYVVNIINTQLRLRDGQSFRALNPGGGIASVTVTQQGANSIRVTVTGTSALPAARVVESTKGLVLSLTAPPSTAQAPPAPTQAPETPTAKPQSETLEDEPEVAEETPEGDEEIEILVTGEQEETGYSVPNATTATRTDTPLRDVPQSIQVIPQQVLEDQQVIRLEEALRNVSSVSFGGTNEGTGAFVDIRGFQGAPILLDGFRQYGLGGNQTPLETANLERIEVLKGPASILFGEIQPGGVINLVSKRPLSEPFYEAELQLGSRSLFRPRIDFSGPLTADGELLYRLNALFLNEESFRDFDTDFERVFVAPTLTWKISNRTDLTFQLEYLYNDQPADFGRVASGDRVLDTPRDFITGEPDDYSQTKVLNTGYNFEHRFNDNWTLRNAFRYTSREVFQEFAFPFSFDAATGIITRNLGGFELEADSYSLQTYGIGKFATGSVNHTLLFGVDLNRTTDLVFGGFDLDNPLELDISNPVYGLAPRPDFRNSSPFFNDRVSQNRLGIYLQDQVDLLDNLKLLAGLRYDTVKQKTRIGETVFDPVGSDVDQTDDAFTPRVGLVYQPIPEISLYTSYSQSFNPNSGTTFEGNVLEPEQGEGWETGIKAELLGGNLFATLAYFDITKQNVATADPVNPFFSIATGEQQSQGVELDVTGEILPGWNIIASYAYIDAEVSQDNTIPVGNRLVGIPKHSASLWTTYEIQRGDLQGLGAGIGFNYVGNRQGDLDNSFELGSYFLTNAAIFYRRDNWRFALNFKNIFDIDYSSGTPFGNTRIAVGEPFTVIGSVSVEF